MTARLQQLVAEARQRVSQCKQTGDISGLQTRAMQHEPRGFRRALLQRTPAVIAELKKASPSKGLIREDFDPALLARELEQSGAAALSVLTEPTHFQGSLEYLRIASDAVRIPILRKDFMVDELQVLEARAFGADAILLIVAALNDDELRHLLSCARELNLDVLCEVHDDSELERATALGFDIIGVNSRDLKTFNVDLNNALRLGRRIPKNAVAVAESGIHTAEDLQSMMQAGFHAVLVGESLMRDARPGLALERLLSTAAGKSNN